MNFYYSLGKIWKTSNLDISPSKKYLAVGFSDLNTPTHVDERRESQFPNTMYGIFAYIDLSGTTQWSAYMAMGRVWELYFASSFSTTTICLRPWPPSTDPTRMVLFAVKRGNMTKHTASSGSNWLVSWAAKLPGPQATLPGSGGMTAEPERPKRRWTSFDAILYALHENLSIKIIGLYAKLLRTYLSSLWRRTNHWQEIAYANICNKYDCFYLFWIAYV